MVTFLSIIIDMLPKLGGGRVGVKSLKLLVTTYFNVFIAYLAI